MMRRGVSIVPCAGNMPARLRAGVQYADDLDEARLYHAVEERVRRVRDRRLAAFVAAVANGKAANAGP